MEARKATTLTSIARATCWEHTCRENKVQHAQKTSVDHASHLSSALLSYFCVHKSQYTHDRTCPHARTLRCTPSIPWSDRFEPSLVGCSMLLHSEMMGSDVLKQLYCLRNTLANRLPGLWHRVCANWVSEKAARWFPEFPWARHLVQPCLLVPDQVKSLGGSTTGPRKSKRNMATLFTWQLWSGLFCLVDSECLMPSATDASLFSKIQNNFRSSKAISMWNNLISC